MKETKTGYRAFPPNICHPAKATFYTQDEFDQISKQQLNQAPSAGLGHEGTVVWYAKEKGYIMQIKLKGKPDIFVASICTFTPSLGMDQIDGIFAQDIEDYILQRELNLQTNRLQVFNEKDSIPIEEYLRNRGLIK